MTDHDVVIYKRGADWIAKFKGGPGVPDTRGKGPSRFEALGDLLERDAVRYAAEKGSN